METVAPAYTSYGCGAASISILHPFVSKLTSSDDGVKLIDDATPLISDIAADKLQKCMGVPYRAVSGTRRRKGGHVSYTMSCSAAGMG